MKKKLVLQKARGKGKTSRATAFTLDEAREIARANKDRQSEAKTAAPVETPKQAVAEPEVPAERRVHGAASLADILGFSPGKGQASPEDEEKSIDKKYVRYFRLLVELRDHVKSGLSLHTEDTLKRSSKDDSGDLSSYSQHMADAGTDTFDRDFALSLVSGEQEALYEIEEAIKRIKAGTYGVCELTGKPIDKERLLAVPFARYSVESQQEMEKVKRKNVQRGGVFAEASAEDGARFIEEDSDE